jgi:hypothetical protein
MNRFQTVALLLALVNAIVMGLFPPYDQFSIAASALPVFSGFHPVFSPPPNAVINTSLLTIEFLVVGINLAIAWLLLGDKRDTSSRRAGLQGSVLLLTGINLIVVLLFPPMESVFALTKATLPTFEGFFFIFDRKPVHVIVDTLLYLEITAVLINSALLWLILRERKPASRKDIEAVLQRLRND